MAGASKSNNSAQGAETTSKLDCYSSYSINRAKIWNAMDVRQHMNLTI